MRASIVDGPLHIFTRPLLDRYSANYATFSITDSAAFPGALGTEQTWEGRIRNPLAQLHRGALRVPRKGENELGHGLRTVRQYRQASDQDPYPIELA